jgi:hypothetical protein
MRRRLREQRPDAPPLPLTHYRGTTNREALAWLTAREEWWDATHDENHAGWLPFLLEGWEQVGDLHWCGSVGAPCGDDDCLCAIPPPEPISTGTAHRATERNASA